MVSFFSREKHAAAPKEKQNPPQSYPRVEPLVQRRQLDAALHAHDFFAIHLSKAQDSVHRAHVDDRALVVLQHACHRVSTAHSEHRRRESRSIFDDAANILGRLGAHDHGWLRSDRVVPVGEGGRSGVDLHLCCSFFLSWLALVGEGEVRVARGGTRSSSPWPLLLRARGWRFVGVAFALACFANEY
jgi:hypothetical protein